MIQSTDGEAAKRLKHIQHFEKLQADNGVLVIKIFLHISKAFQYEKLKERIANPEKHWKFDINDLQERKYWENMSKLMRMFLPKPVKKQVHGTLYLLIKDGLEISLCSKLLWLRWNS